MQSFAPQQSRSSRGAIAGPARSSPSPAARPLVQRMPQAGAGYRFEGIPVHAPAERPALAINRPGDEYEREADATADRVMGLAEPGLPEPRPAGPQVQRACACGGTEEEPDLQARHAGPGGSAQATAPPIVHDVLGSPGRPLDGGTRGFMEARFGRDFGAVRIHDDARAGESARAIQALGYTVGRDIVFGPGQYAPATSAGRRLLAHELAHVVQQGASRPAGGVVQRQMNDPGMQQVEDMDAAMERKYANSGAPKAQSCGRPSWCPGGFCSPYNSEKLAEYYRSKNAGWLLLGISAAVDSRVVPFWKEYIWGGSAPKNITADFAKDFTNSPTTKKTTTFLSDELKKNLSASPPAVATTASIDIKTRIPTAIAAINDDTNTNRMNFSAPRDIPGNLAGGIGTDQKSCPAGAKPSPFNDERIATGTAEVAKKGADLVVTPLISYTVKDTIDLCPGDCGAPLEQVATVPLSQFEATGISGDVPFWVDFPAPSLGSFTIPAPAAPAPAPAPAPPPAPVPTPVSTPKKPVK